MTQMVQVQSNTTLKVRITLWGGHFGYNNIETESHVRVKNLSLPKGP